MNFPSLVVQAAASLAPCFLGSVPLDMSNGMTTASESLPPESVTESCQTPPSSAISKHSLIQDVQSFIEGLRMLSQPGSLASPFPSPESKREPTMKGICGPLQQPSLGLLSPDSFCLKTCRESVPTCPWLSETCADLGMKFQDPSSLGLMTLGRRTEESGCGYTLGTPRATQAIRSERFGKGRTPSPEEFVRMWPTPRCGKTTDENEESWTARQEAGKVSTPPLTLAVKMWPTPTKQDGENNGGPSQFSRNTIPLNAAVHGGRLTLPTPSASMVTMQDMEQAKFAGNADRPKYADCQGGALNPEWVEWLMGWPLGWTDLKPLEMDRFHEWWRQHGGF